MKNATQKFDDRNAMYPGRQARMIYDVVSLISSGFGIKEAYKGEVPVLPYLGRHERMGVNSLPKHKDDEKGDSQDQHRYDMSCFPAVNRSETMPS